MRTYCRVVVVAFGSTVLTGCAGLMGESLFTGDRGRVLISADKEGLRALNDGLNGLIVTGKSTPDSDTSYHQLRRAQEVTRRMKYSVKKPKGES